MLSRLRVLAVGGHHASEKQPECHSLHAGRVCTYALNVYEV